MTAEKYRRLRWARSVWQAASKHGIRYYGLPEDADASFFLCKILTDGYLDGISGEYSVPAVYFVEGEDVENIDKAFPPKQKQKPPGQLF